MFKCIGADKDLDLKLTSIQVTYANMTKTSTPWTSDFNSVTGTDFLRQRYVNSIQQLGLSVEAVGCESYEDWLKRGCYYHFSFERDASNRSTEVQVVTSSGLRSEHSNIILCAHYSRVVDITSQNGSIVSVNTLSV